MKRKINTLLVKLIGNKIIEFKSAEEKFCRTN